MEFSNYERCVRGALSAWRFNHKRKRTRRPWLRTKVNFRVTTLENTLGVIFDLRPRVLITFLSSVIEWWLTMIDNINFQHQLKVQYLLFLVLNLDVLHYSVYLWYYSAISLRFPIQGIGETLKIWKSSALCREILEILLNFGMTQMLARLATATRATIPSALLFMRTFFIFYFCVKRVTQKILKKCSRRFIFHVEEIKFHIWYEFFT